MRVTLSLTEYEQTFRLPRTLKCNKMRLVSASIYNINMISDEQPLYINIYGMDQNFDVNSRTYYTSILFPHAVNSWYIYSRDLNNFDYENNETKLLDEIKIIIDYRTGSLGSNKINLEFEFI